jgi:hypothetical protein
MTNAGKYVRKAHTITLFDYLCVASGNHFQIQQNRNARRIWDQAIQEVVLKTMPGNYRSKPESLWASPAMIGLHKDDMRKGHEGAVEHSVEISLQGCRCSTIGPRASAGRKESAPINTTEPSTNTPKVTVSHGREPIVVGLRP